MPWPSSATGWRRCCSPDRVAVIGQPTTNPVLRECSGCGLFQVVPALGPGMRADCLRCGTGLRRTRADSLNRCLALTAAIRANPATAELPVILVTSLQTPEQREAGLRAGADAYFTKGSFDQDRLLATVRRVAGMEAP